MHNYLRIVSYCIGLFEGLSEMRVLIMSVETGVCEFTGEGGDKWFYNPPHQQ